ncbi:MAPEG family protein [Immundisolibacter sp.]|uniref:MAPEG family protein n=1 Tax=Immundisolibacter sp. TaxID=1934948 RepID=UPI002602A407|nr:MAPEG family protein [Immundisolibacter sp.]MDD3651522.1 MAPEG family protein [Immundisolibacter sp.]
MTIAYWCVLALVFFPPVLGALAKSGGGFDNRRPRECLAAASGWRKRADWAQQNAVENFAPFAAAVIIGHQLQLAQGTLDQLALAYLALRVLHAVFYIADLATLRSLSYIGGLACIVAIFVMAA